MASKRSSHTRSRKPTTRTPEPVQAAPTAPTSEPTFTLRELHALMGDGYVPVHRPADALDFAEEALGAAAATLALVSEALSETNITIANAVHGARMRVDGAIRVLDKLGRAQRGEVQP